MRAEWKVVNSCERIVPALSISKEGGVKLGLFWIVAFLKLEVMSSEFIRNLVKVS